LRRMARSAQRDDHPKGRQQLEQVVMTQHKQYRWRIGDIKGRGALAAH
jgi:hypothetical protein